MPIQPSYENGVQPSKNFKLSLLRAHLFSQFVCFDMHNDASKVFVILVRIIMTHINSVHQVMFSCCFNTSHCNRLPMKL